MAMVQATVAVTLLLILAAVSADARSTQAYVTLLYGDQFLLGVRVLGQSIRDTGTTRDLVVLTSDGVSKNAIKILEADGWIVEPIDLVPNPNEKHPDRFWGVYTKLTIFNLTQYEKIVYLDADTIVIKNIDDLFLCQKFCANLKHSERFNSGVMVVEPSQELFKDMAKKVGTLPSYTGGDQGFLNSYYPDFPNAQIFNASLSASERKPKLMERLSTLYNADIGLYMLANKWMVDDESELRVVHYTLGPLKPWDWYAEWLLKPVGLWQNIRRKVDTLPSGQDRSLYVGFLFGFPLSLVALLLWFWSQDKRSLSRLRYRGSLPIDSKVGGQASANVGTFSILVFFSLALLSVGISFYLIPRQVMPWTGMFLLYEWTFFLTTISFGMYLDFVVSAWGRRSTLSSQDPENYSETRGHSKASQLVDYETIMYGFSLAALAILVPCLPFVLHVSALFSRLGMIVGAGMLLVAFATYAAQHLGIRWFMRARVESLIRPSNV